jgi:hypothetical protein
VASTPRCATNSSTAFKTFWWALALRVRGIPQTSILENR